MDIWIDSHATLLMLLDFTEAPVAQYPQNKVLCLMYNMSSRFPGKYMKLIQKPRPTNMTTGIVFYMYQQASFIPTTILLVYHSLTLAPTSQP
jgi:hypothetical protein